MGLHESLTTTRLPQLLRAGGDSRQTVDPMTGRNEYGCTYEPDDRLVAFGSCTASTISSTGYAAAERVFGWLRAIDEPYLVGAVEDLFEKIRRDLLAMLLGPSSPGVDVMVTPSGTDAELVALACFDRDGSTPIDTIVVGPFEVGSGTALAAGGLQFDSVLPNGGAADVGAPVDNALADRVTVRQVPIDRERKGNEISCTGAWPRKT